MALLYTVLSKLSRVDIVEGSPSALANSTFHALVTALAVLSANSALNLMAPLSRTVVQLTKSADELSEFIATLTLYAAAASATTEMSSICDLLSVCLVTAMYDAACFELCVIESISLYVVPIGTFGRWILYAFTVVDPPDVADACTTAVAET